MATGAKQAAIRNTVAISASLVSAGVLACAILAGPSSAQEILDTEYTPTAKPSALWTPVGGARFGGEGALHKGSPAPFSADFFAVDFLDRDDGFFAGAACADAETPFENLNACERVPVIYRYFDPADGPPRIEESYRGEGPGFVGAISWIGPGRALAVGGDGAYPRREPGREIGESDSDYAARDESEGAGMARAWLYSGGSWEELGDENLPGDMRALTAVDCSPREELCIAGGLQQLWHWRDGGFDSQGYSSASQPSEFANAAEFRFRVRQIRFNPAQSTLGKPEAYAVTSGCCISPSAAMVTGAGPRLLVFAEGKWSAQALADDQRANGNVATRHTLPDSYYSIVPSPLPGGAIALSVIASPGGPPTTRENPADTAGEPGSLVLSDANNLIVETGTKHLRLAAADGDFSDPPSSTLGPFLEAESEETATPDGVLDWAVGSFRGSRKGAAFTTLVNRDRAPNPTGCTVRGLAFENRLCHEEALDWSGDATSSGDDLRSKRVVALPTYALNAFTFDGVVGWAAGDKGAILRLGGEGTVGVDVATEAPRLGPRAQSEMAGDDYEASRPATQVDTGAVPPLAARPLEDLERPALIATGTPDATRSAGERHEEVTSLAMSRDGSQGWAVGSGFESGINTMTLYRYDGARWSRCEMDGIPGSIEPDSACAGLAPLRDYAPGGRPLPVSLSLIARVPLENDTTPTNDDDFEAIALGTRYRVPGGGEDDYAVLRYRGRQWELDVDAMKQIDLPVGSVTDLAFSAPGDGWIVGGLQKPTIYRFDGEDWTDCRSQPAKCGDAAGLLPLVQGAASTELDLSVAGDRLFLAGTRLAAGEGAAAARWSSDSSYPMILSRDPESGRWEAAYDPGCASRSEGGECVPSPDGESVGQIDSVEVSRLPDGRAAGWAMGRFGAEHPASLLRLRPGSERWEPWRVDDAAGDYLAEDLAETTGTGPKLTAIAGADAAVIAPGHRFGRPRHPLLVFDAEQERWSVLPTPFVSSARDGTLTMEATVSAFAPDGHGGLWLAVRQTAGGQIDDRDTTATEPDSPVETATFFYRYASRAPKALFAEAPHPVREPIADLAGAADGSVWVATDGGALYRYDRVAGWARTRIPGWDPGQVITRPSRAGALALGPGGEGIVVGEQGRIAEIGPGGVILDRAAGVLCGAPVVPPCGTAHDLRAAAVAPDGATIAAGDALSLLWRPAGGQFRAIDRPAADPRTTFTGAALPAADRAWLTTADGRLFAGRLEGGEWDWVEEGRDAQGRLLARDADGDPLALRDIALDAEGAGYAIGERGVVLRREPDGERPWRRLDAGSTDELWSLALPPGGEGDSALIGGGLGLILTVSGDEVAVARPADYFDPLTSSIGSILAARIVGVALLPGYEPGQAEAWAASQVPAVPASRLPAPGALLHYSSDPSEPLLDPSSRVAPLPDAPALAPGSLSFAAFGRSECREANGACPEAHGANLANERVAGAIADRLASDDAGIDFALLTGDIANAAGRDSSSERSLAAGAGQPNTPLDPNLTQRRWVEVVAERLADAGVPLYGAIGGRDLTQANQCARFADCIGDRRVSGGAGLGTAWREAMAGMPEPWGEGDPASSDSLSFEPLRTSGVDAAGGGASTHYALDITDRDTGEPLVRLVVLDSSLRSLAASDPIQSPVEPQMQWLESVLCVRGSTAEVGQCTREPGQRAIVLTNTPTYSYSAQVPPSETATDAAALEEALLRHDVDVALGGRVGWNGVYWVLAPGLHHPRPGAAHPDPAKPPAAPARIEGGTLAGTPVGALPFVVASGAGGGFGPDGTASGAASEGFWRGYSVVHLDPETGEVQIEQRPVFDWIGLDAKAHTLAPRERLALRGYGREPAGMDVAPRYAALNSHATTHRYELLEADPAQPWLPRRSTQTSGGCAPYVCLSPKVARVDRTSGIVRAGDGDYPHTYAIASLSVGEEAASWPLIFEPGPGFHAEGAFASAPVAPHLSPAHSAPPPAGSAPPPLTASLTAPPAPPLPTPPPASIAPPPGADPPPPAAPPLPSFSPPLAATAFPALPASAALIPPVKLLPPALLPGNAASPSGARRETRQPEAAAREGEADAEEPLDESEAIDPGEAHPRQDDFASPNQAATRLEQQRPLPATRRERERPYPSISAPPPSQQPSAWITAALYGGMLLGSAFMAAVGWGILRGGRVRAASAQQPSDYLPYR